MRSSWSPAAIQAVGAGAGGLVTHWWHTHAGWIAAGALVVALMWLIAETRRKEAETRREERGRPTGL